jgi:hypothetical protein
MSGVFSRKFANINEELSINLQKPTCYSVFILITNPNDIRIVFAYASKFLIIGGYI